jgi:hypothetical protein
MPISIVIDTFAVVVVHSREFAIFFDSCRDSEITDPSRQEHPAAIGIDTQRIRPVTFFADFL